MTVLLTSPEFLVAGRRSARRSRRRSNSSSARCGRPAPRSTTRGRSSAAMQQLGMPLYQCQPPTGYKDTADAWVNTGALVNRMNVALALASGRHAGRRVPRIDAGAESVVAGDMSDTTRATIAKATDARRRRWRSRLARRNFRGAEPCDDLETRLSRRTADRSRSSASASRRRSSRGPRSRPGPTRRSKQLIAIFQRGAVDGLSVIVPYGESDYYRARPSIAIAPAGHRRRRRARPRRLLRLQPASGSRSKPLWDRSDLAIVHACGSPDATRSHFDAQDYMETATPGVKSTGDGWLNRYLQARHAEARDAVPRRRADATAAAHAAGHGAGAGDEPDRAVRHPRREHERVVRSAVCRPRPIAS